MTRIDFFRISAAVMILLIGLAIGAGGLQLWRGGAQVWPDVIAGESVVRRSAAVFLVFSIVLLALSLAVVFKAGWAFPATVTVLVMLLAGAIIAQLQLFGTLRAMHIATNFLLAAIIIALLRAADVSG